MSSPLVQRVLKAADRVEETFMIVALTFMTVLTVVQVALRYGFGSGLVWSLEVTTYTFAWLVLIGMSYGVRTEAHIAVDLVTSRLSPGAARVFAAIALFAGLAYCALMIYGSSQFVDRLMTLGTNARDIPLPRWALTGIMPVAFGLLALRLVQAARPVLWPRAQAQETPP
jgi:C4-dicarboxylate transporter DctQ subunit